MVAACTCETVGHGYGSFNLHLKTAENKWVWISYVLNDPLASNFNVENADVGQAYGYLQQGA